METLRKSFLSRGNLTVWILIALGLIILMQNTLSEEIRVGQFVPRNVRGVLQVALTNQIWFTLKLLVFAPIAVFWLLNRRRQVRRALHVSLGLLTFELLTSVSFLVITLADDTSRQAVGLIRDTISVALINILVFSLWYWVTDAEPLLDLPRAHQPNEWLFPQYSLAYKKFETWEPNYFDYLFLAFTTTTAFGPTDTLPLSRRAKVLMMLQALLSLVIIVVLAGRALSILR